MQFSEILKTLVHLRGVSGLEDEVREAIQSMVSGYCSSCRTDPTGNLIVEKEGRQRAGRRVVFSAPMDEHGFQVTSIDSDGMLRFGALGDTAPSLAAAQQVLVGRDALTGVVGIKPIHLLGPEEREAKLSFASQRIDLGASSAQEAQQLAAPGDMVTFGQDFTVMGESCLRARALESRAACAMLVRMIRSPREYDCTFVFTVQSLTASTGAKTAAFQLTPDVVIPVEGVVSSDFPGKDSADSCVLGGGPVIPLQGGKTVYHQKLYRTVCDLARKNEIPFQTPGPEHTARDAAAWQGSAGGAQVLPILLPVRYPATAHPIVDLDDLRDGFCLLGVLSDELPR